MSLWEPLEQARVSNTVTHTSNGNFGATGAFSYLAGTQGFEPRYAAPEAAVLPLDDVPTVLHSSKNAAQPAKFAPPSVVHGGFNMNRRMRLAAAVWWCAFWSTSTALAVDWTALKPQG